MAAALVAAISCSSNDATGTVVGLKISPDSVTVALGSSVQFTATDLAGQPVADARWSISDPTKAVVSASGLVTAVAPGRVTLNANAGGKAGVAVVRAAVAKDFTVDAEITQGTQSADGSIPMVLGGNAAVVNVLVGASQSGSDPMQVVLRLFDAGNNLVRTDTVRTSGALSTSPSYRDPTAQFLVPASQLASVASWQVVRDPRGDLPDLDPGDDQFPRSGRAALAKVTVPALAIRFVPIILAANGAATGQVTTAQLPEYLRTVRSLHPLGAITATIGTPLSTQANFGSPPSGGGSAFWQQVLAELDLARVSDVGGDPNSYWMGILVPPSGFNYTQYGGYGYIPSAGTTRAAGTRTAVAVQIGWFSRPTQARDGVAHELGHNFGRAHAPCGGAGSPDPLFPYGGGVIGVVGHDVYSWANGDATSAVPQPTQTGDVMGYCSPVWISDYMYRNELQFRGSSAASLQRPTEPVRSLIVRGRIEDDVRVVLEPAFTIPAWPTAPERTGRYQLTGRAVDGRVLFQYSFEPATLDHSTRVRHFLFAIPATESIDDSLSAIEVTGAGPRAVLRSVTPTAVRAPGEVEPTAAGDGAGARVACADPATRGILIQDASSGTLVGTAAAPSMQIGVVAGTRLLVSCSDGVKSTRQGVVVQ